MRSTQFALFARPAQLVWQLFCLMLLLTVLPVIAADEAATEIESVAVEESAPATYEALAQSLAQANFPEKTKITAALAQIKDERVPVLLKTLLDGRLYYRGDDNRIVLTQGSGDTLQITDAIDGSDLGAADERALDKITVNNSLRGKLRSLLAEINLHNEDSDMRLTAVREMFTDMNEDSAVMLRALLPDEPDDDVREWMELAIAMVDINSEDKQQRVDALEILSGNLAPEVRQVIQNVMDTTDDADIKSAAAEALDSIQTQLKIYSLIETTFFGISLGTVLLLIAVGLAITFGVMGVINMAHGELMMLGAYTTYVVQQLMPNHIDISIFVAIPLAFLVSGLVGVAIERGVIRFMYGRPLETLLATFGISLVLQQVVRSIFSPLNRAVETPSWMSGSLEINSALSLTYNRLYIIVFALLVFIGLLLVLKKTALGLQVRAVSQNRAMAKAMGVRTGWVDAMTFGLGSGIAGVAGVALSQLTNVGPNLGQGYIVDSFMVVVFGGVGNLWGTLVGALSLGVVNKYLEPWTGAVLAKILVLVVIILFIQKRPRGLFPQKGRAAEN